MELSKRLFMTASMVERESVVADVGCDHGYTAIYLVKNGICPRVLAMDVREGPLARAREHIREAGLSAYIETRLSDGLSAMQCVKEENGADGETSPGDGKGPDSEADSAGRPGHDGKPEADTLLMAGIGGRLASRILEDAAEKLFRMRTVIVQPQSELWLVRRTLCRLGYRITAEDMVKEDGKFYTAIRARNRRMTDRNEKAGAAAGCAAAGNGEVPPMPEGLLLTQEAWEEAGERYGYLLIMNRHAVLSEYLEEMLQKNAAARTALLAGAGVSRQEGTDRRTHGNGRPVPLPERSRKRLIQLEGEADLAERLSAWMKRKDG